MKRLMILSALFLMGQFGCLFAQNSWKSVWVPVAEPFSDGAIDVAVATNGNIYVATVDYSGVLGIIYVSTDTGKTGFSVGRAASGFLFPGPGGSMYAASDLGLYKLESPGSTWQCVDTSSAIAFDIRPDGKFIVVAALWNGIRLSTDGGTTWKKISSRDTLRVQCLKVDTLGRIFAVGYNRGIVPYEYRLYVSSDTGRTWKRSQLPGEVFNILDIAFDGTSRIYAVNGYYLLQSTDGGATWGIIGPTREGTGRILFRQGNLYAIANGVLSRSEDHGITWKTLDSTDGVGSVAVSQSGGIFITTGNGGLYYSTDGGTIWTRGLVINTFSPAQSIATDPNGTVIAGTNFGVYSSTDDGDHWHNYGLSGFDVYQLRVDANNSIFAATTSGLYRAIPPAQGWRKLGQDSLMLNRYGRFAFDSIGTIIFGSMDTKIYTSRIIVSTDSGETWRKTSLQMPHSLIGSIETIRGTNFYVVFDSGGTFRSTDRGISWKSENTGFKSWGRVSLLVYNGKYLFCTYREMENVAVYRSTEDTVNWKLTGLKNLDIKQLAADPSGGMYAATLQDLFYSSDDGDTWQIIDSSSTVGTISALATANNKFAFALTAAGTILRRSVGITSVKHDGERTPNAFQLFQNYPNPYNPATVINYDLVSPSMVNLRVFDILGREVATLVNESQKPGAHTITFDGARLSSGIYFYQLQAGISRAVKKMVLMK